MPVERRGQAIRVMIALVNWQQEKPNGCGGGQQLSMNGTSRVNREIYARFCERLGVKFPGPTRRCRVTGIPTATASPGPWGAGPRYLLPLFGALFIQMIPEFDRRS